MIPVPKETVNEIEECLEKSAIQIVDLVAQNLRIRQALNVARSHIMCIGIVGGQDQAYDRVLTKINEALR